VATILIVEDELVLARQLERFLRDAGHEARCCSTGQEAVEAARSHLPDLVLLDLRLPDRSGHEVLEEIRRLDAAVSVVVMTGHGSVRDAVDAMRAGAAEYLQKPLDLGELGLLIERLMSRQRRDRELAYLRQRATALPEGLVGNDPRLAAIFDQARRLKAAALPPGERPTILLTGETGTGKGVVAGAVHEILDGGPFIEVNCTAMPASLVEAELFGHERGTFTDARTARAGLFEAADGGTIFLDEVGDLDPGAQSKFLKVIEEKRVRRLGSTRDRTIDVQVIAATHQDLDEAVKAGCFREDLLHRLRVLTFEIPPLRERPDDLREIARHYCEVLGQRYKRRPVHLSPDAEALLAGYAWPGNVRELRNVIERALLLASGDRLGSADLAPLLRPPAGDAGRGPAVTLPEGGIDLESLERDLIRQALERTGGNRTRAAGLLGLSRDTLRYRLEKYGLG
jgi:DNA-binding NtrC family response regulator